MPYCELCGNDSVAHMHMIELDDDTILWECNDDRACDERRAHMEAPCCGIPEAPHPGCCDHTWARCSGCGLAGPYYCDVDMQEPTLTRQSDGSYLCKNCKADLEQPNTPCDCCIAPEEACDGCEYRPLPQESTNGLPVCPPDYDDVPF